MHAAVAPLLCELDVASSFLDALGSATVGGPAVVAAAVAACPMRVSVVAAGGERVEGDGQSKFGFPLRVEFQGRSWDMGAHVASELGTLVPTIDRALQKEQRKAAANSADTAAAARAELCARLFCGDGVLARLLHGVSAGTATPKAGARTEEIRDAAAKRLQRCEIAALFALLSLSRCISHMLVLCPSSRINTDASLIDELMLRAGAIDSPAVWRHLKVSSRTRFRHT